MGKGSWKEYSLDNKTIDEWLAWGGITHDTVLRQKDDSVLGVIRYKPYMEKKDICLPQFPRGWMLSMERQQTKGGDISHYLTVCWNPAFTIQGKVKNTVSGNAMDIGDMEEHLAAILEDLRSAFPEEAEAEALNYQDLIDYLTFSISMGERQYEMPDPPIDLDIYLTDGLNLAFAQNHVRIGDKVFVVLSLPSILDTRHEIYEQLFSETQDAGIPSRHVMGLRLYGEQEAKKELKSYTAKWTPSREYVKDMITDRMLKTFNGYFTNTLVFLIKQDGQDDMNAYLEDVCTKAEIPFIIEDYNAKYLWFGTIPGLHRAGIRPPITGFDRLESLLYTKGKEKEGKDV